jgi:folate-binding protein YgfZ
VNEMTSNSSSAASLPAAVADLGQRTRIELTGRDRAKLLHNLCTNDILSLRPGQGCEAFLTSVQGKVLGHIYIFCHEDSLVLDTVPQQAEAIERHIDRYIIREDVQLHDRTQETGEWLLAGSGADLRLSQLAGGNLPVERLAHRAARLGEFDAVVRRVDWVLPMGLAIQCNAENSPAVGDLLESSGARRWSEAGFDAARIEAGTPLYGRDITDANLPQEVARDALAIHFAKGCYLGQETVARIDALGHVNKLLVGVRFWGDQVPAAGTELFVDDKVAGHVTSACRSPSLGAPLALAYVRRGHQQRGTRLASPVGEAEVVALPLL